MFVKNGTHDGLILELEESGRPLVDVADERTAILHFGLHELFGNNVQRIKLMREISILDYRVNNDNSK